MIDVVQNLIDNRIIWPGVADILIDPRLGKVDADISPENHTQHAAELHPGIDLS